MVQARITLSDTSHAGDRVEFTVDGIPHEATINQNRRALISLAGYSTGQHVVELTEPPGCFEPVTVTCPDGLEKSEDDWEAESSSGHETPATTRLHDNYPNPFNPTTIVKYDLTLDSYVTLKLYDVLGREVRTLVDGFRQTGYHQATLDATGLASGIYFYRLAAGEFTDVKRMLLTK
jgi:hypothetical protein